MKAKKTVTISHVKPWEVVWYAITPDIEEFGREHGLEVQAEELRDLLLYNLASCFELEGGCDPDAGYHPLYKSEEVSEAE
jgi:hypothetical protein